MFRRLFSCSWLGLALARPLLTAAAPAAGCCAAGLAPAGLAGAALPLASLPAEPLAYWIFLALAARSRGTAGRGPASGASQFAYRLERHWWLLGGVRTLPTGLPLGPQTSSADRTAYALAGLGLGYRLSPTVRALTNWNRGLGPSPVSPGSQFTVGLALHY